MIKVNFADDALSYVKDTTDTITLTVETSRGWGGIYKIPAVYVGKPDYEEGFNKLEIDGINIYVDKNNPIEKEGLKIDLRGFGSFKRLVVNGFIV